MPVGNIFCELLVIKEQYVTFCRRPARNSAIRVVDCVWKTGILLPGRVGTHIRHHTLASPMVQAGAYLALTGGYLSSGEADGP
jgi:hypothetical protein